MKKGNRVKFKDYEYKDKKGTVIQVFYDAVILVQIDNFEIPVATMIENLEIIEE